LFFRKTGGLEEKNCRAKWMDWDVKTGNNTEKTGKSAIVQSDSQNELNKV